MTNESEVEVTTENTELDLDLDVETPEEAPAPEKPPVESPEAKLARLKRQAAQLEKKLGVVEPKSESKSGKLDETQLDYLDLKGISETEDIEVIQLVMKNTGKSLRDVLKDDYVVHALNENATTRNVRNAIPGSSKRAGVDSNSVDYYVNKWKSTGKLPDNFELQSKVVDAIAAEKSDRRPSWMR